MGKTKTALKKKPGRRVGILDTLRGFSLVSMVLYHALFDLVYMFGVDLPWYRGLPGYVWQQSICWVFILVSGASLHYGRSTARRGVVVLACGLAVSLVTYFFMPGQLVVFGILHFLGAAMLLFALLRPLLERMPAAVGLVLFAALFVLTRGVPQGFIGLLDKPLLPLPVFLYQSDWLFFVGLPGPSFYSGDYFPLVPWFWLFLCGYFAWALCKRHVRAKPPGGNPLAFLGRHSLLIYMLHQPVVYGLFLLLQMAGIL